MPGLVGGAGPAAPEELDEAAVEQRIRRVCKKHGCVLRPRSRLGFVRRGGRHLDDVLICPARGREHRVGPGGFRVVNVETGEVLSEETDDV